MLLAITNSGKVGLGVVAGLFIVFALLSAFWFPRRDPNFPGNRVGLYVGIATLLFLATIAGVVVFAKESEEGHEAVAEQTEGGETGAETGGGETAAPAGDPAAGEQVFTSAGCVSCHTLEAAGATGTVGPNLDEAKPDAALVEQRVRNGQGVMPAFEGQLTDKQIEDVVAYVVQSTSG